MDDLVEKVARAVGEAAGSQWPQDAARYRRHAQAALAAIRVEYVIVPREENESARLRGQAEGKAAVLSWLRGMSAQKPSPRLAGEAEYLADAFEQTEAAATSEHTPAR